MSDVRYVTCRTPLTVIVAVPGAPVPGLANGKFSVTLWNIWVNVTAPAPAAVGTVTRVGRGCQRAAHATAPAPAGVALARATRSTTPTAHAAKAAGRVVRFLIPMEPPLLAM